jgi:hypothetical protein
MKMKAHRSLKGNQPPLLAANYGKKVELPPLLCVVAWQPIFNVNPTRNFKLHSDSRVMSVHNCLLLQYENENCYSACTV